MGETSSCNSCAVAAPGGGPGSTSAAGAGAGAAGSAVAATLGCACTDDGATAGWSSPREQPVSIGDVDIRTAAASINGSDRPFGLASSLIVDKPSRQL